MRRKSRNTDALANPSARRYRISLALWPCAIPVKSGSKWTCTGKPTRKPRIYSSAERMVGAFPNPLETCPIMTPKCAIANTCSSSMLCRHHRPEGRKVGKKQLGLTVDSEMATSSGPKVPDNSYRRYARAAKERTIHVIKRLPTITRFPPWSSGVSVNDLAGVLSIVTRIWYLHRSAAVTPFHIGPGRRTG